MLFFIAAASASEWTWTGPEPGFPPSTDPIEADGCSWSIDDDYLTTLKCGEWIRQSGDFVGGAALAVEGDRVVVATFSRIASGARVSVYDKATGQERWTRPLSGLGPIGHSEYYNAVELRVVGDRVEVFGWEAAGRYIEHLALDSGTELGLWRGEGFAPAEVPAGTAWTWLAQEAPPATSTEWVWDDAWSLEVAQESSDGERSCGAVWSSERSEVWCGTTEPAWRIRTTSWSDAAAIELDGDTLYVLRFHPIATGATAYAYRAEDGTELWRQGLWGCGPVSHSKYRNEVQIRVEGDALVVTGRESSCSYVEVLDRASGAALGHRLE